MLNGGVVYKRSCAGQMTETPDLSQYRVLRDHVALLAMRRAVSNRILAG